MLVVGATVVFGAILLPVRLSDLSVESTYTDGMPNYANRLAYIGRRPGRGDIVAIRTAAPNLLYVGKVIDPPSGRVAIETGRS